MDPSPIPVDRSLADGRADFSGVTKIHPNEEGRLDPSPSPVDRSLADGRADFLWGDEKSTQMRKADWTPAPPSSLTVHPHLLYHYRIFWRAIHPRNLGSHPGSWDSAHVVRGDLPGRGRSASASHRPDELAFLLLNFLSRNALASEPKCPPYAHGLPLIRLHNFDYSKLHSFGCKC